MVEGKPKAKEPKQGTGVKFPLKTKINKYGFLHFSKALLTHLLGHQPKKVDIPVEINEAEGGVVVRLKSEA